MKRAILEQWVVDEAALPARLDAFVQAHSDAYPTRAAARKACVRGEFLVDGDVAESSRWLCANQQVAWLEPLLPSLPPLDVDVGVVYEDDVLAVVHKPAGLPTSGPVRRTLERALVGRLSPSPHPDALVTVRAVHRLDASTQGVIIVAKTRLAHAALGGAFAARQVHKHYRALVVGALQGEGVVDAPIDGREARTRYAARSCVPALRGGQVTTVDVFPETGRTHQIRRHLAHLGVPVLGDGVYGQEGLVLVGKGLFLVALAITFPHPITGAALTVGIDEPTKFEAFRDRVARQHRRHRGTPSTNT